MARLEPVTPNHTASATVSTGIATSFSTKATLAARLGRKMPSGCRPAPVTSRPIASDEPPSASATSCQSCGSGTCATLMARPITQAQINGFFSTVITMAPTDRFSDEAYFASTATLKTLTSGMIATIATEASARPVLP